jgi:paraquat-inducible protein B
MNDEKRTSAARAMAKIRQSWWPGWIWAIPIAVLIVVGWLGLRALTSGGTDITIVFDDTHGLSKEGSTISYRGTQVGTVTGVTLTDDGNAVNVSANIDDSAARFLRSETRFWLSGAHPSISNLSSLKSILAGPTIVMDPGPGKKTTHFEGLARKPIRPAADARGQPFHVSFAGAVGTLRRGDPVKFRGFTVGEVEEIGFRFDARTGEVATPVTLMLFPALFHIHNVPNPKSPATLRTAVGSLVRDGLRARLERDPPLIGGTTVTLEMGPKANPANSPTVNGVPEIPALPHSGGVRSLVARLNDVPLEQIGQNALAISKRVDTLVSSPELEDSVTQLHAALVQIRKTTAAAGPKINRLVDALRKTAQQLDQTARSTNRLVGGPASQTGLTTTMREATEAARAIRELADYLDRHPEALIHGRSDAQ